MTSEDLMRPRYKVISDYPEQESEIGDIFHRLTFDNGNYTYVTNPTSPVQGHIIGHMIERMPHLFKKLEWWEERKPEEMPEYLRWVDTGVVCKYHSHKGAFFYLADDSGFGFALCNTVPATLKEYEQYKQKEVNNGGN